MGDTTDLSSFPPGGVAAIFGAGGGIGSALADRIEQSQRFERVFRLARRGPLPFDLLDEQSMERACGIVAEAGPLRLAVDATGFLHDGAQVPEKRLSDLRADWLARAFALNAIGPALVMKHLLPRMPRQGKAVFATLSARVGSIGDNRLGGWYAYRASKAALNQILVTAAVELRRSRPEAVCLALHPGTVATDLSAPFAKDGLDVQSPDLAAARLLTVLDQVSPGETGQFLDQHGQTIAW